MRLDGDDEHDVPQEYVGGGYPLSSPKKRWRPKPFVVVRKKRRMKPKHETSKPFFK